MIGPLILAGPAPNAGESTDACFRPPLLLKSGHVQTLFNGIRLRRVVAAKRARAMTAASRPHILDCGDGVRLHGYFAGHGDRRSDLAILIHGWRGDADSAYILSAAGYLYDCGYDIFRLNLRDHGPSHHLNRGLFHACRINEVVGAVKRIQTLFARNKTLLAGFSLGGNFALRVAIRAPRAGIALHSVVAVCPVLNPSNTLDALENGWFVYHRYYLDNWRRSVEKKRRIFPEISGIENLWQLDSIREMTDSFARRYTEYPDAEAYLNGYCITGNVLSGLQVPARIIAARNDPIIPAKDIHQIRPSPQLHFEIQDSGGHCAFFDDFRLHSWADRRIAQIFDQN